MSKSPITIEEQKIEFAIVRSLVVGLTQKPDYLIEGLIEKGDQVLLYGQPKVGKTFLAIQLACALATQRPFLKWNVKQKRKVLYINFEMGERVFAERISKYLEQPPCGLNEEKRVAFFDKQIEGQLIFSVSPRRIEILSQNKALKSLIVAENPDFIIFDTLAKLHSEDEKENNAIQGVLTEVREVCQMENKPIAHMIVHHARKTSINITDNGQHLTAAEIRGGSAIRGEADIILGLASNTGGAGGGAKMKLIMEARNVRLEDLDIEVGDDRIFRPAAIQTTQRMKEEFYEMLRKADAPLLKSEIVDLLIKNYEVEKNTVTKAISNWEKEDSQLKKKKGSADKRRRLIWLESSK